MSHRPIRILQFINSLAIGGAENRLAQIVCRLNGAEFEFAICCLSAGGPNEEPLRAAGVSVETLGYKGVRIEGKFEPRRLGEPLRMIRELRGVVERVRPDVVHTWLPISNFIGGRALGAWRFRRVGLIASRVFTGEYRDANLLMPLIEEFGARRADLIYCNCQAVWEDTLKREPALETTALRVIRNGVDLVKFAPPQDRGAVRRRLGIGVDEIVVLCVGALRLHKGHADLLRAAAILRARFPQARFLFAGADQGEDPALRRLAQELKVEGAVEFLGPRTDVPDLLGAADVCALPSLAEGLPNALLEAQACAVPCVATDLPGCAEAIADGETGFLVPPGNPARLTEAIARLLGDAFLRKIMGKEGRKRAEQLFPLDRMLAQFAALYREAADLRQPMHFSPNG